MSRDKGGKSLLQTSSHKRASQPSTLDSTSIKAFFKASPSPSLSNSILLDTPDVLCDHNHIQKKEISQSIHNNGSYGWVMIEWVGLSSSNIPLLSFGAVESEDAALVLCISPSDDQTGPTLKADASWVLKLGARSTFAAVLIDISHFNICQPTYILNTISTYNDDVLSRHPNRLLPPFLFEYHTRTCMNFFTVDYAVLAICAQVRTKGC